ncbi:hypothetical protein VR45_16160 [Streptomyces sp. NRRL S-495]|nr:hypothetical protein VR45_16160 [Streptomyces sp. NRRL S-495]
MPRTTVVTRAATERPGDVQLLAGHHPWVGRSGARADADQHDLRAGRCAVDDRASMPGAWRHAPPALLSAVSRGQAASAALSISRATSESVPGWSQAGVGSTSGLICSAGISRQ